MSLFATEFHRGFRGFTFTYTKNHLFFYYYYFGIVSLLFSRRSSSPIFRQRKKKKDKKKEIKRKGKKIHYEIYLQTVSVIANVFSFGFKTPPPNTSHSTWTSRNTCIYIHTGTVACIYAYMYSYTYKGCVGGGWEGGWESSFCLQTGI